ncbi:MAG: hemerythrin domain-containing protein [Streptosporangiaceae bacterium]
MLEPDATQARATPWQEGSRPRPAHGFTRSHPAVPLTHRHAAHTTDIIELLLAEHGRLRRLMDAFDNAARHCQTFGVTWLGSVWERVAEFIEFHIEAEEEICYLAVFRTAQGGLEQMDDAIADHDDIREALLEARLHAVTTQVWWQAVTAALRTCRDQLARYERGPLAEFGLQADPVLRNVLGYQWTSFTTARARDDRPGHAPRNRSLPLPHYAQLPRLSRE